MDVQGDYDPVDAAGFIKINALRYVIILLPISAIKWTLQHLG